MDRLQCDRYADVRLDRMRAFDAQVKEWNADVAQKPGAGERFRHVWFGVPSIGGRYSALSNFGMVPAAIMGLDVGRLLDRAELMVHSCAASVPAAENPAIVLGAILSTLAAAGRDKVTLVASPGLAALGAWLEQLIAESTGKRAHARITGPLHH